MPFTKRMFVQNAHHLLFIFMVSAGIIVLSGCAGRQVSKGLPIVKTKNWVVFGA